MEPGNEPSTEPSAVMDPRTVPARLVVLVAGVGTLALSVALLLTPWLGKHGGLEVTTAFHWTLSLSKTGALWLAALSLMAVYGALVTGLARRWMTIAVASLLVAGLVMLGQVVLQTAYRNAPPLWQLQTDWDHPIAFTSRLQERRTHAPPPHENVAEIQAKCCAAIAPLTLEAEPTLVYRLAIQALRKAGYKIISDYRAYGQIEGMSKSAWFGLEQHMALRIMGLPDGQTRVDARWAANQALGEPATGRRDLRNVFEILKADLKAHQAKNEAIRATRPQPR